MPAEDALILQEQTQAGVVVLTFNRPQSLNALSLEMMQDFAERIQNLAHDDDLRVVVITGAGQRAFCSGGDLTQLKDYESEADARHMITVMGDALYTLERLPVPVIAAINGYALGGGSEIALACDMRIADARVRMGMVQIKMALTPGWGAGQRLMRTVGYARAMEILLKGEPMHAERLDALHLVNSIVPEGESLQYALDLAEYIASQPQAVVRAIKQLLQAGLHQPYEMALQTERDVFPPLWADQAHLQAVANFFARQAAKKKA
jgi:enoyl-CoA hydratase/carnithine racemase